MRTTLIALASTLAAVQPAHADEEHSPGYEACLDRAAGVTSETLDCLGVELDRADAELNRLWQLSLPQEEENVRVAIRAAQRDWIAFRDNQCKANAENTGDGTGTASTVAFSDCLVERTLGRLRELKEFFAQE